MEEMTCPECQGIQWVIYGNLFETNGSLLELQAECANEACKTRMNLGIVDGAQILPMPGP
jgi:hypothetical protein